MSSRRHGPKPKVDRAELSTILATHPELTQLQLAELFHCTKQTIYNHMRELRPSGAAAQAKLEQFQKDVNEVVSVRERAQAIAEIVKDAKSYPLARLHAVRYANEVDGILTALDQARIREASSEVQQDNRPVFMLPTGSHVTVNVMKTTIGSDSDEIHNLSAPNPHKTHET